MTSTVQLRRVVRFAYGDSLASESRVDGVYPVVGSGGVSGTHNKRNFRAPGIVIGRKGSYGSVHWIESGGFAIDTAYYIDERMTSADLRWLYYILQGIDLRGVSQDVGVPGLSREAAYAVDIPSPPPLEEQRRIADFLDAEIARIDRVISIRRRQAVVFEERRQAVVDHFLVQQEDPMVHLARLCRVQSGVTVDGGRVSENAEPRPYLRVANVQADGLDLSEVKEILVTPTFARRYELRPGDVLMTEGGDLDKLGRGTVWSGEIPGCLHQNHVFAVRPNSRLSGEYLALLTRTSLARSYFEMTGSKTTNLASTSSGKILAFRIPLLELDEQLRRTKEAEKELSQIAAITTPMAKQIELLAERRQALITAAVTGEFDVSAASGRGIEE